MTTTLAPVSLEEAITLVWLEADSLDHRDYSTWLTLWADEGKYVIPIDPEATDYADRLNYAYDDAAMRRMRVARLTSGESMSARDAATTVRSISRFRVLPDAADGTFRLRCAQHLVEYKRDVHRSYVANVTFTLQQTENGPRILEKVVRLINSTGALAGMSFLL